MIQTATNPHMKGTLETLKQLYGEKGEDEVLLQRFAMINSAKCAGRDDDASTVPDEVHDNCREHGLAELSVLDPQLIVTQGAKARSMLDLQDFKEEEIREQCSHISLAVGDADVGDCPCCPAMAGCAWALRKAA